MGETAQEVVYKPVISQDERRSIVRNFVKGFLSGSVKVTFWEVPSFALDTMKETPGEMKSRIKSTTIDLIKIVSGSTPATDEAVDAAIDGLFSWIVSLRSGDFIVGEFVGPPEWESRLSALEQRVSSIEKLFEELLQRFKVQGSP